MQRIAMWSGPRNISTAMMRSFENRPDSCVIDEPFYGYYLAQTGIHHPGHEDIIASMDCHWHSVARSLTQAAPDPSAAVYYQNHMTKHMLPEIDLSFLDPFTHCFLIRKAPPVIDSALTLQNPQSVLSQLCERINIPFHAEMLHWPPGPRDSDGIWAPHWYASVEASTGFAEPASETTQAEVPARYEALCQEAEEIYAEMLEHVIRPE